MELEQIIKHVELFQGLDDNQLKQIVDISKREIYAEDDTLFQQDGPGDCMYVITQGQIEVRVRDEQGDVHSPLYLGEGQIIGEVAMLDEGTRSASAIAADEDTIVYKILRTDFNALCQRDTALGYNVMRNLALDLSFKLRHRNLNPHDDI